MKQHLLLAGIVLSSLVVAKESVAAENVGTWKNQNHVVGVNFGLGSRDFEVQGVESDSGNDNAAFGAYYRYMMSHHWGLELGYHKGSGGFGNAFSELFGLELPDLDYRGYKLAGYGRVNLSERNYLYGKLGANFHNMDYEYGDVRYDNSGVDAFVAGGWEYLFDNGIGLNIEVQHLPMDDLKVTNVNLGFSYHF